MKLVVWDFHGVLEKGTEVAALEVSNLILDHFGYTERFEMRDVNRLWGKRWFEYFEWLLPGESHERHLELQNACFKYSNSHPELNGKYIKLTKDAIEVLSIINDKDDFEQIVISNTKVDSLPMFLNLVGVTNFFPDGRAFAVDSHADPTRSKLDALKEFLEGKEYDDIIIVGDSPGDMALKQVAGGKTFLFAHPDRNFRDCDADHKINDLREVLKEL